MRKLTTSELHRLSPEDLQKKPRIPVVVVLDDVRSAYNVGSVFRTCDAFAVEQIFLCGITAFPPNREVMKTALGSTETVPWKYYPSCPEALMQLKNEGYHIYISEQTDESILLETFTPELKRKYAIVFGNEIKGVSDGILPLSDGAIEIPQFGAKHSFNVSVSVGIVLWQMRHALSQLKSTL
jgi:23S rRNA (guanosine2251-2'-O)-methyltransferase